MKCNLTLYTNSYTCGRKTEFKTIWIWRKGDTWATVPFKSYSTFMFPFFLIVNISLKKINCQWSMSLKPLHAPWAQSFFFSVCGCTRKQQLYTGKTTEIWQWIPIIQFACKLFMSCIGLLEEEAFWVLVRMWYIIIVEILSKPYIVYGYLIVCFLTLQILQQSVTLPVDQEIYKQCSTSYSNTRHWKTLQTCVGKT